MDRHRRYEWIEVDVSERVETDRYNRMVIDEYELIENIECEWLEIGAYQ
jgi:hypothetical protein